MYDENLRETKQRVLTNDGSYTLYSAEFDEPYHSDKDGALHEALQKHVLPAFALKGGEDELTLLDICYGLGYNTLATLYYIKKEQLTTKVKIISPEFDKGLVESLRNFQYPKEFDSLREIIDAISRDFCYEDEQISIEILLGDARQRLTQLQEQFDIVYQDAFSPAHNPLLWTREYFATIASLTKEDSILTTYSTAAAVRMGLDENGFQLFFKRAVNMRDSMVASPSMLDGLEYIDMQLKKIRNPHAKSLRDEDYL